MAPIRPLPLGLSYGLLPRKLDTFLSGVGWTSLWGVFDRLRVIILKFRGKFMSCFYFAFKKPLRICRLGDISKSDCSVWLKGGFSSFSLSGVNELT